MNQCIKDSSSINVGSHLHSVVTERAPSVKISDSKIDGQGLFSLRYFNSGDTIAHSKGRIIDVSVTPLTPEESRISFQIDAMQHFVPEFLFEGRINGLAKINHSCEPNSYVTFDGGSRLLVLVALQPIAPGCEITCDYCATEATLAHPFSCCCGSSNCRKLVR